MNSEVRSGRYVESKCCRVHLAPGETLPISCVHGEPCREAGDVPYVCPQHDSGDCSVAHCAECRTCAYHCNGHAATPGAVPSDKLECRWEEVDVNVYETCSPGHSFFLRPDHELPDFCEFCGKPVVGVDPHE